ncbi:MAG: response regulator [Chitinophagaceae bacterium]|nr:response regulator [Bacteroidota bacterium]MCC6257124.1 response regulator [Chitinophagaceae bacterium]MCW5916273.1 response regulator [Ferruginibacter sp.]
MIKILVVDDEPDLQSLIRQRFRQMIREQKFNFSFAVNGLEAIRLLKEENDIEVMLTDINMPEMDGLTLLSRVAESHPLLKSVVVSAYGDMTNIRTAMNRGAFDFVTKPVDFEDLHITIDKAVRQAEQMKDTLKAIKENNILKMYVDQNVLNFMDRPEFAVSLTENETLDATVAFIDICGFTAVSEREPPDTVVKMLNEFFEVMVKEIISQGGAVDKFIGDCIMAVFRGDYHLDRAIDASLAIVREINKLHSIHGFNPQVSIGINSGEMISGNIGSVTLKRLDYTVIGDTVNTAQRLQSTSGRNQILIPEACYEKVKQSFDCKPFGKVALKNKTQEMMLYEVVN